MSSARTLPRTVRLSFRFVGSLLLLLGIGTCGDGGGGTDPVPDGTVAVTITTTGADLPTGYSFTATSSDQSVQASGTIPANGTRTFTGITPGVSVQVQISDIPENCTLAGQNPRSVSAVSAQTTTLAFQFSCVAKTGSVRVLTVTAGTELDADGYTATVGTASESIGVNDSETFAGLSVGNQQVQLSGVDGACTVSGENPRTLAVAFNQTAETTFQIVCPVKLTVNTETIGEDLDGDGYSLAVDGGAPGNIGVNASQDFALSSGDHTLQLTGVAVNCMVAEDNPRTVTLAESTAGETTFQVTCQAIPGDIDVTVTTTGWDIPTEFGVSVDTEAQGNIGSNATLQLPGWSAEEHTVGLTGVPANCSVQGGNSLTLGVVAGQSVDAEFTVACGGVAFESDRDGGGSRGIFIGDSDGLSPPTRITPGLWFYQDPTWSPDRTRIAYSTAIAEGNPNLRICVIAVDGTGAPNCITPGFAEDTDPEWSPDGTKIAFMSDRDGNREIYVMNADGSGLIRLTNNDYSDYEPSWSPDGSKIVFYSHREDDYEIFVMNSDGSSGENWVQLTNNDTDDEDAVWSPDGTLIVFKSDRDGEDEIYVMNADGSSGENPIKLTNNTVDDDDPEWSPDGTMIAFTSERDGNDEIYIINVDGSGLRNLTNHPSKEDEAGWRD